MKKIISLMLCLLMIISIAPVSVFAADNKEITKLDITLVNYVEGKKGTEVTATFNTDGLILKKIKFVNHLQQFTEPDVVLHEDSVKSIMLFFDIKPGYDKSNLKKTDVTVNGEEPAYFDRDWTSTAEGDLRVYHYIYPEKVQHKINTIKCTANKETAARDETVKITADELEDKVFDRWELGDIKPYNKYSAETYFKMPDHDVWISPVYVDAIFVKVNNAGKETVVKTAAGRTFEVIAEVSNNQIFSHWEYQNVTVSNAESETITVTVGENDGSEKTLKAVYEDCSCNCHKGGIAGFFFKLINFFQKLFGKNKICACGVEH